MGGTPTKEIKCLLFIIGCVGKQLLMKYHYGGISSWSALFS